MFPKIKLIPCPMCGSEAEIVVTYLYSWPRPSIRCKNPHCRLMMHGEPFWREDEMRKVLDVAARWGTIKDDPPRTNPTPAA